MLILLILAELWLLIFYHLNNKSAHVQPRDYDLTIETAVLWRISSDQFYTPLYFDHQVANIHIGFYNNVKMYVLYVLFTKVD